MKLIRENAPLALFLFNTALAFALVLQFAFAGGGYRTAEPILKLAQSDVAAIEIIDPREGLAVTLKRGAPIAPAENSAAAEDEDFDARKAVDRVRERLEREAEFDWELVARQKSGPERKYRADGERVKALFTALGDARRYYSVPRTPEKDRELDMGKNDRGEYDALRVVFERTSGEKVAVFLGRSPAGSTESYLRLGEEDRIFLVQSDLRTAAGQGEPLFFRDRSVWTRKLSTDRMTGLVADFPGKKKDVTLLRGPEGWRMGDPEPGKVRATEIASLLNDIADWKADAFPEELPEGLEEDSAFELEISYKDTLTGPVRPLRIEVLGKKDYSTYYIRRQESADGKDEGEHPLVQVTSVYLSDFYEPERKLKDVARPGSVTLPPDGLQ